MAKLAVFASGRGSNLKALHAHLASIPGCAHQIAWVVSDKPECGATEFARQQGIETHRIHYRKDVPKQVAEEKLLQSLGAAPDLLVFAGFMRIVSEFLVGKFPRRIVNLHPTLLPKYPGAHGIEESFASGDRELGITVHYVDAGLDSGEIIMQTSFMRQGSENLLEIETRIHELEHRYFPRVVTALADTIDSQ